VYTKLRGSRLALALVPLAFHLAILAVPQEPKVSELGGKRQSLAVLMNNRFNVPKGFMMTSEAFLCFKSSNWFSSTSQAATQ
jgi:phosphoenolpyruvate synthase/pyruvate phosphate dikinase